MLNITRLRPLAGLAMMAALASASAVSQNGDDDRDNQDSRQIKHVFVIAMENHNWTQPAELAGQIQQIYQNPNAPFINSLVSGTAVAWINGRPVNISQHTAYAISYHNVLATQSGNNAHIHPSEPNYIWAEAGTNFGIANDDDPFKDSPPNAQNTTQHLTGLLQKTGRSWKSYQEDIDLATASSGQLTNVPLPQSQWTAPIVSHSGVFDATSQLNAYNDSLQYNYAVKHNPMAFFVDKTAATIQPPQILCAATTPRCSSLKSTWPTILLLTTTGSLPTSTTTSTAPSAPDSLASPAMPHSSKLGTTRSLASFR